MPDPAPRQTSPTTASPTDSAKAAREKAAAAKSDAFLCDRCGTEMFRMHAVWRCPGCGFKTDCCGW